MNSPTTQEKKLLNALKKRGVECMPHYNDGFKTVDIAINKSKMIIEVDGLYHYLRPKQIVADIKRERYSEKNGFSTIHIFNSIIDDHLEEVADAIAKVAKANNNK